MSNGSEMPERPRDRFETPQYLIDDIDSIGTEVFDDVIDKEMAEVQARNEVNEKDRAMIVELLKALQEPSSGDGKADREKAEFIIIQLREMGCPVDGFYNMLGQNFPLGVIANKMLQERDEESNECETLTDEKARIISLLQTILTTMAASKRSKAIVELSQMGYPKSSYFISLHQGTQIEIIADRLINIEYTEPEDDDA